MIFIEHVFVCDGCEDEVIHEPYDYDPNSPAPIVRLPLGWIATTGHVYCSQRCMMRGAIVKHEDRTGS